MRQFYYKRRQLLQNAMILLQNTTAITKCTIYYKMRRYTPSTLAPFSCQIYQQLDNYLSILFLMGTGQDKFSSWHPIGHVKTGMQNQSARQIDKQLETLLFVILYSLNVVRCAIW